VDCGRSAGFHRSICILKLFFLFPFSLFLFNSIRMSDSNYFIHEDPWRIFRIMAEFVDSFQTMSQVGPAVTVFGSARTKPNDKYYRAAVAIGKGLAKHNLAVITGGGPGIMEAANKGAMQCGGKSVGLNIELPHEQFANQLCPSISTTFSPEKSVL
jgi:SLOG cluster4 family